MTKCRSCGAILTDEELREETENGEVTYFCPICNSRDLLEVESCKLCEEYVSPDDMAGGVCMDCLYKNATAENFLEMCDDKDYVETVAVNEFLASMFTSEEIDSILRASLKGLEAFKTRKAKSYLRTMIDNCDEDCFIEWLLKSKRRSKNET